MPKSHAQEVRQTNHVGARARGGASGLHFRSGGKHPIADCCREPKSTNTSPSRELRNNAPRELAASLGLLFLSSLQTAALKSKEALGKTENVRPTEITCWWGLRLRGYVGSTNVCVTQPLLLRRLVTT